MSTMSGMPNPEGREAAREAVRRRLGELGWSVVRLAEEAAVSYNAVNEFLAGRREWPRSETRLALERALSWSPGALERIAVTSEVEITRSSDSVPDRARSVHVLLDLPPEVVEGMTPAERAEAEAAAVASYLERVRIMRQQRGE